jgi:hypothetical protein
MSNESKHPVDSPIPEEFENWISDWLRENVVSDPGDWENHNAKVVWARAIAIDIYRHVSSQLRHSQPPSSPVGEAVSFAKWTAENAMGIYDRNHKLLYWVTGDGMNEESHTTEELYAKFPAKTERPEISPVLDVPGWGKGYDPIGCDHKIKRGKYTGLTAFQFFSEESGSGPDFSHCVSTYVCPYCGAIKRVGHRSTETKVNSFDEVFDLSHPDAVEAIVKNCNYMNRETDDYVPFVKAIPASPAPTTKEGEIDRVDALYLRALAEVGEKDKQISTLTKERDTARNDLQKMIDEATAKSKEAGEYRDLLNDVYLGGDVSQTVDRRMEELFKKYPLNGNPKE